VYPTKYLAATTIICALVGSLCSCQRQPELVPRLIIEGEPVGRDFYLSAPYIAVVKITKSDFLDNLKAKSKDGPPKGLALIRYDAIVENAIRGTFPTPSISFYFFANFDQPPRYDLRQGETYIVSLRTEAGVFCSFSDGTQLKIEVDSGSHNQQDLPLQLGSESVIAYILMTPGNDLPMDEHHFAAYQVGLRRNQDDILAVPKYAYELWTNLQKNADPRIRDTVCRAGAEALQIHPKCITADNPDPASSERLRDEVIFFQKTPLGLLPERWSEYLVERLEIYTDDPRPEVRSAACVDLRNIAPERKVANCR
jgi:hypothetical protein